MITERKINKSQYEKAAELLSQLFEFDLSLEKQINIFMQNHGIMGFFERLEEFEFDVDSTIKIQAVKDVLFGLSLAEGRIPKGGAETDE